ncbi:MAG: hypothetical protein FJ291_13605 [Planctomycetes bacterium]|nr:hypothetical protein [Planctomycetota bacterium]
MGNIHFTEIADFFLGWLGYDISKDDWATRIAEEKKATASGQPLPTQPSVEPAKKPPEKPAPKPPSEPPPKQPPKEKPRKPGKYELHELVP